MADDQNLLSMLRPERPSYSTTLYVDSLAPVLTVPFQQDSEVMLILEGFKLGSGSGDETSSQNKKRFVSTLEVESSFAADGRLTLTPLTSRSVEVTPGIERSFGVTGRSSGQRKVDDEPYPEFMVCRSAINSVSCSVLSCCIHCYCIYVI